MAKSPGLIAHRTAPAVGVVDALESQKSDSVNLTQPVRGIYVGASGDLVITTPSGETATFVDVPAGMIVSVECIRLGDSTTATGLVGLY